MVTNTLWRKVKTLKEKKESILKYKILYSITIMLIYMVGRNIPLYGIDLEAYNEVNVDAQSILVQSLSGNMKNCTLFILGIWPYMVASLLMILVMAFLSIDSTRRMSPKKLNKWTLFLMMLIGIVQAWQKVQTFIYKDMSEDMLYLTKAVVFVQLIAGMLIVVYMCDRAVKYGIGGRMSVFMINIVDGMMRMFAGQKAEKLIIPLLIGVIEIAVMLFLETTEKRIAVQRVSIHNIHADKNYIAYKLNPVGAMPLMFASAVFMLPGFLSSSLHGMYPDNQRLAWVADNMSLTSTLGISVYLVIIFILTLVFSLIMLAPGREAESLLKSGDSIEGIYAGKPTWRYLVGIVVRFSIYSSLIVCICQGLPLFLQIGGYIDSSTAMLPGSIMMSTGIWISLYREGRVYRQMDQYKPFI